MKLRNLDFVITYLCCCYILCVANGKHVSNKKSSSKTKSAGTNYVRSIIQNKPIKKTLTTSAQSIDGWNKFSLKELELTASNVKKALLAKKNRAIARTTLFKRWPLRSPYEVAMDSGPAMKYQYLKSKTQTSPLFHSKRKFDDNVHSRSSIIPCLYTRLGTRKECIETNQQEQQNIHNKLKQTVSKQTNNRESSNHVNDVNNDNSIVDNPDQYQSIEVDSSPYHKNKEQKLESFVGKGGKLSDSTKALELQKTKNKDEEAQRILHSDNDNIDLINYHKQKGDALQDDIEKAGISSKNENESENEQVKSKEREKEMKKARDKDKELKMKAMKLRMKDEDNFEDQNKIIDNKNNQEENKNKQNKVIEKMKSGEKIQIKVSADSENDINNDNGRGPQSIAEMKDERNPETEKQEKKLEKETSKTNNENNSDMQSKLLQEKLEKQSMRENNNDKSADIEDALISSQPHKIRVTDNKETSKQPVLCQSGSCTNYPQQQSINQYQHEQTVDNQFFKLWREDLLIKQKFIERMTNMDTKYLGLLYRIGKSLDSISHALTNGFKVINNNLGEQLNTADMIDKHYPQQPQPQLPQKPNNGMSYF